MRWVPAILGGLLLAASACGGGGASSTVDTVVTTMAPSSEVRSVGSVADALVASLGDEPAAMAALLLSADRGYTLEQIVEAVLVGTIDQSGSIMTSSGQMAEPAGIPANLLIDDTDFQLQQGFARPQQTAPVSSVFDPRTLDETGSYEIPATAPSTAPSSTPRWARPMMGWRWRARS